MKIERFISGHVCMCVHYCFLAIISCAYCAWYKLCPLLTEYFSQRDLNILSLSSNFWTLILLSTSITFSGNCDMNIVLLLYILKPNSSTHSNSSMTSYRQFFRTCYVAIYGAISNRMIIERLEELGWSLKFYLRSSYIFLKYPIFKGYKLFDRVPILKNRV